MANRVTDQTTQNALIEKFRLDGILPEMEVLPSIIPVVNVANLDNALTISAFEKWRSVFTLNAPLIDVVNSVEHPIAFGGGAANIYPESDVRTQFSAAVTGGFFGAALPGGSVGVNATDGIYFVVIEAQTPAGTNFSGNLTLYQQAAFGSSVAIGISRSRFGFYQTSQNNQASTVLWKGFLKVATTDQVNALVMDNPFGVNGTGAFAIRIVKLIDELPPNVIFP